MPRRVDALVYTRGEVLPALELGYDLQVYLPDVDGQGLALRQAVIHMRLTTSDLFGSVDVGYMPVPTVLGSEDLRPDWPVLIPTPVLRDFDLGSQPGARYVLDWRDRWLPLRLDLGFFAAELSGSSRAVLAARLEVVPWGRVDSARWLRLAAGVTWLRGVTDDRARVFAYGTFRWLRLWAEAQGAVTDARRAGPPGVGSLRDYAWHTLLGFDLLPEFFRLSAGVGQSRGTGSLGGAPEGDFVNVVGRMFVLRRRVVLSFEWRGLSLGRTLSADTHVYAAAFDLRF